jgi:peptide/nickel transport system permease protein
MLGFIARRIASGVILLGVISTLAYFLVYSSSSNIAINILGPDAPAEAILAKQQELGLDKSLLSRYADWALNAIQGNFGNSWFNSESVISAILHRLPVTLTLVLFAMGIAATLATLLGIAAATKGGWVDRLVQILAIAGFAIPGFLLAIFLVTGLAIKINLLPATGWVPFGESPANWLKSLILPVVSLVVATVASAAQQIRSAIKQVLERDFVKTLTSRGISRNEIIYKHILRAAAPAGLTVLSLQFVGMLGGSVIIEKIFALPGMGEMAVNATAMGDTPVVMGVVVYTVIIVIAVNLIVDLVNGWLNPKVRVQ